MTLDSWRLDSRVFCRIGSLERLGAMNAAMVYVFCRIGSLERLGAMNAAMVYVFCRIGSLEK